LDPATTDCHGCKKKTIFTNNATNSKVPLFQSPNIPLGVVRGYVSSSTSKQSDRKLRGQASSSTSKPSDRNLKYEKSAHLPATEIEEGKKGLVDDPVALSTVRSSVVVEETKKEPASMIFLY
jgi:hypothetical protein